MRNDLLWLVACAGCTATLTVFLVAGGAIKLMGAASWISKEAQSAATFFVQSTTSAEIRKTYSAVPNKRPTSQRVRVLIVPGHQPNAGGTEFRGLKERDVVVDIADSLEALLLGNPRYEVTVTRDREKWNPIFQAYFDSNAEEIEAFIEEQKREMQMHIELGNILTQSDKVHHNKASSLAAIQLYGINKWANENNYDIVLHLHLNDETEHAPGVAGEYGGFAVYVPNHQYSNAEASRTIGEAVAARLNVYHATSTLPKEDMGIVEDQDLIAIGSNNTSDAAAILVEYGYIYEPQFRDASVRPLAVDDYAYATYLGLQDFFKDPVRTKFGTRALPYNAEAFTKRGEAVYALQVALRHLKFYPPDGKNLSECPISGIAGACTRAAIKAYQKAIGLEQTGEAGPRTRSALELDTRL